MTSLAELGLSPAFPRPQAAKRIGIVGLGGISAVHQTSYREAGWPVAMGADISPGRREWATREFGLARTTDRWEEVVEDPEVEVVSLLTHPSLREKVLEACIAVGKPLLVEKPLAATVEEGRRMAEAAERAGLPTTVSQNYRWLPGPFVAKALIGQGRIGTPFFGTFEIHGTQDRDLKDHPVYSKDLDFITVQWNTHLTDLLRHLLGRDATRVFAQTRRSPGQNFDGDNLLVSAMEFGEAATGHVLHSELARSGMTEDRFRIDGDQGTITGGIWAPWLTLDCESTGRVEIDVSGIPRSYSGPMGDLLACVESGVEPALSFRRNLPTLMCVMAEFESAQSGGRWMELDRWARGS